MERYQYGYDADGNVLYRRNPMATKRDEAYVYDGLNRLASYKQGTLNSDNTTFSYVRRSKTWGLDTLGNWITTSDSTYTYNQENELTSVTTGGTTTNQTYDNAGSLKTDGSGSTFTYDAWNRLVAVSGSNSEQFTYDGLGRRMTETVSGTKTNLYYSNDWQVLEERTGQNTQATTQYVWSIAYVDGLVERDRSTANNGTLDERIYVACDANWNVTGLYSSSGAALEHYVYDPYGSVLTVTNGGWVQVSNNQTQYAWRYLSQGHRYDWNLTQYDVRNRQYAPTLGRWMQADPLDYVDGMNRYQYEGSNPVNSGDPSGEALMIKGGRNHFYPLYLGGYPKQPVGFLDAIQHPAFHEYFDMNGIGFQDANAPVARVLWSEMGDVERINHIVSASEYAGISPAQSEALIENMPDILAGSTPGIANSPGKYGPAMWPASDATGAVLPINGGSVAAEEGEVVAGCGGVLKGVGGYALSFLPVVPELLHITADAVDAGRCPGNQKSFWQRWKDAWGSFMDDTLRKPFVMPGMMNPYYDDRPRLPTI